MRTSFPVGFNPLPFFFVDGEFDRAGAPLPEIYARIRAAGFGAVPLAVPERMTLEEYRTLLEHAGLAPAPGYFAASFADSAALPSVLEQAKAAAGQHAALGLDRIFIAERGGGPARLASPGTGADFDAGRLHTLAEHLGRAAETMAAEGVLACLHPHVATWIETPAEIIAVLEAIPASVLRFGPDTGHLAWAGADVPGLLSRYAERVGAVHLKDFRRSAAPAGRSYRAAVLQHVWTEPGRGDLDFAAIASALSSFTGWYVVEVDVADQPSAADTAAVCAGWVRAHFGAGAPA